MIANAADHSSAADGQLDVGPVAAHGWFRGVPRPHHGSDEAVVLAHAGRRHLHAQPLPREQLRAGGRAFLPLYTLVVNN